MRSPPVLLGALLAVACSKSPPPPPETPASTVDAVPAPDTRSVAMSMKITPSADLLAWLDQQSGRAVRLPVTLTLSATGGVASATIGVNGEPDAVAFQVSDLGMGISLKDRLRKVCKPGGTCAVWLIGTWNGGTMSVRKMDGAIDDAQRGAATDAEVVE
jgi:hypothetical protein